MNMKPKILYTASPLVATPDTADETVANQSVVVALAQHVRPRILNAPANPISVAPAERVALPGNAQEVRIDPNRSFTLRKEFGPP